MNWNDEKQTRLDELRQRETEGTLTTPEQQELETLMTSLTQAADDALLPAITRLQKELTELQAQLQQSQHENNELVKLLCNPFENRARDWRFTNDDYHHGNH